MSATRAIASYNLSNHQVLDHRSRSRSYALYPYRVLLISTSKHGNNFLSNQGLSVNISRRIHCKSETKMDMTVQSSVQPGTPAPPSNSWRNWILGTILSIFLPFWRHKWAPLLTLKREVDSFVETIDTVVEVVEKVAEEVEKVADEVADSLPEGGKLQEAVRFIEHTAEKVAEDAHATDELIHKVEEVEKEVETITEMVMDQENSETKEASEEK